MHCSSKWRHDSIIAKSLNDLTPTENHLDDRFKWKVLPSMQMDLCMHYPLVCWITTEKFYIDKFLKTCPDEIKIRLQTPVVDNNGNVLLIKGGNNRFLAAQKLSFTSIDCLIFEKQIDAIKWTKFLSKENPYFNLDLDDKILTL